MNLSFTQYQICTSSKGHLGLPVCKAILIQYPSTMIKITYERWKNTQQHEIAYGNEIKK